MAERLGDMPAKALRELYDSLDLKIHYQSGDSSLDIGVTIAEQVCLVPPAGAVTELPRQRGVGLVDRIKLWAVPP